MKSSILLFIVSILLFTLGLHGQEIINFDARFYLFAQEMWRHGVSWFPTTYGQPYPDYPGLSTFLIYLSACSFGGLTKFTAVLPSAIAAALTVVVTYRIGCLREKKLGFYAVFMLFCTLGFIKSARSIALDMYPTLITACCFYLMYSADLLRDRKRIFWIYPLLILGFIFRGPIGLVMPAGVVSIYYLITRNIRQFFVTGVIAFVLLLLCLAALLALAYHVGGMTFVADVWRMEVAGRMGNYFQPFYFYFYDSFVSYALTYPLALLAMISLFSKQKDRQFFLLLTGWVLVIMLGMSIPTEKKVRYILPMVPALSLLAASLFTEDFTSVFLLRMQRAIMLFLRISPGLLCAATAYAWHLAPTYSLTDAVPFLPFMIFFAVMQAVSLFFNSKKLIVVVLTVCLLVTNFCIIEPVELHLNRTRDFVVFIEKLRQQKAARLGFYQENPDELPIRYLVNLEHSELPLFFASEKSLQDLPDKIILITSNKYFARLTPTAGKHCRVLTTGRIGHVEVTVFEYNK